MREREGRDGEREGEGGREVAYDYEWSSKQFTVRSVEWKLDLDLTCIHNIYIFSASYAIFIFLFMNMDWNIFYHINLDSNQLSLDLFCSCVACFYVKQISRLHLKHILLHLKTLFVMSKYINRGMSMIEIMLKHNFVSIVGAKRNLIVNIYAFCLWIWYFFIAVNANWVYAGWRLSYVRNKTWIRLMEYIEGSLIHVVAEPKKFF